MARDRGEAPLFGDIGPEEPWLWLAFVGVLALLWVHLLHFME